MTYQATSNSSEVSSWRLTTGLNITVNASLTVIPWSAITTEVDPFGDGITVSSGLVTLPTGQYFITCQLNALTSGSPATALEWACYNGTTKLGYEGRIVTWTYAAGNPMKDMTSRAFIDVTGASSQITIKAQMSSLSADVNSTTYSYDQYNLARLNIWRLR